MRPKKVLLAEDDIDDQKIFYDFLHHRADIVLLPVAENGDDVFYLCRSAIDKKQFCAWRFRSYAKTHYKRRI